MLPKRLKIEDGDWQFLYDAYTGLGGFRDGSYLIRHKRETEDKYARRRELAVYPNYVRKVVDTFTAHVFKRPPQREMTPEYKVFARNTDKRMTYIDDFMRRVFKLTMIFGTVFVIVDKPKGTAVSKAQELEMGLTPYATVRLPSQLESYELDEFGNLKSVTFKEETPEGKLYRYFDAQSWRVLNWKGDVVDEGEHSLGILPVVRVALSEPLLYEEILSEPFIWTVARLNLEVYNLISEIREILRNVTFPVLVYPVRDESQGQQISQSGLQLGTENALLYNPDGGGKPEFIAPSSSPVEVYMEVLRLTVEQIYRSVNLEFALGAQTQRSGVALEFEFQSLNTLLAQFSLNLEQAEEQIANLVARWNGKERFEGTINYVKDFSYRDVERELKLALDSLTLDIGRTFSAELKKKVARMILGDWSDDRVLSRIDREAEGLEGEDRQLKSEGL